ncbi:MAG TPA: hypothetical protein VFF29_05370 [Bacteroidota bacterium]|nr:hypothetical protein [Bacteroidota bacterium]
MISSCIVQRNWIIAIAVTFFISLANAQVSDKISKITFGEVKGGEPLSIQVDLAKTVELEKIEIAYRQFGQREYKRMELPITSNAASGSIPATELASTFLEYYFILFDKQSGSEETYPLENPIEHPLTFTLPETQQENQYIVVLSPEDNERLKIEDAVISFSIQTTESSIDKPATKVYLNGSDVSGNAVISDDLFVISPPNIISAFKSGSNTIRVELFDNAGKSFSSYSWKFTTIGEGEAPESETPSAWVYTTSIQMETRHETIAKESTPFNRSAIASTGSYGNFSLIGRLYVTNEEKDNRQPQNRFFIGAESRWLKIGYGDSYPTFPELIMSGRRLRGLNSNLTLGFINVDLALGSIVRKIDGRAIRTFPLDSLNSVQNDAARPDQTGLFAPFDNTLWAEYRYGTYQRDVVALRTSFGSRERTHWGFSYFKAKDDVGSIKYGIKPEENLVVGSDLLLSFDNKNFEISGQGAFSVSNKDISGGTFTDTDIDSIFRAPNFDEDDRDRIRNIRDIVSKYITVNENIVPLSLENLPTLAYQGGLSLNYFNNSFKFLYLRNGNNFESFGQTFIRTDIVGYNIADRLRIIDNQVHITGGFERLEDNTAKTKAATTTTTTTNVSVSYYPSINFPNVTVGYLLASNTNGLTSTKPLYAIDDVTNRFLVQLGKEIRLGARHQVTLNFSTSAREDQTAKNLDTRQTTFGLSAVTSYAIPLQTIVNLTLNSSKFSTPLEVKTSYTTLYANAQYRMMEDKLRWSGSVSPTFGDVQRMLIDASTQYFFYKNFSAQARLSLYLNQKQSPLPDSYNDTIWSIILRADV